MNPEKKTKQVMVGAVPVGGGAPVSIQSMLSARSDDIAGNAAQAKALAEAGCDIVRFALPDLESVRLVEALRAAVDMPLVADIHFDHRIALAAVAAGVDKIRLNPGNIGGDDRVKQVAAACRAKGIPIRIGVNGGSLEKHILEKHGHPTAQAMVDSALYHVRLLERFDFDDIVISLKASDVRRTVEAYRLMALSCDYPLHLGVTEAGTARMGLIKSAVGIGSLLVDGIGDTLRVSLTADPVEEIRAGKDILKAVGRGKGVTIISCPTCGRTRIDLIGLARQLEEALRDCPLSLTVAVMGCAVNGPGEAREADIGVAGGEDCGVLFARGEILGKVAQEKIVPSILKLVRERMGEGEA